VNVQLAVSRVVRCFFLDVEAFAEVQADQGATLSALLVVVFASYAAGLGGAIWTLVAAEDVAELRFLLRSFLIGSALQVAVFVLWAAVTLLVLQQQRIHARFGAVLRVLGYGFAPMALQLLIFAPALDQPIGILALAATLVVTTYGLQVTTGAPAFDAFTACLAGFVVFCLVMGLLGGGQRNFAPGLFALSPNPLSVGLALPGDGR